MKKDAPVVVVIDGQGGMIGRKLCDQLLEEKPDLSLLALGTNSAATSAMLKGKAKQGATGENPVLVAARRAAVIAGPASIVVEDGVCDRTERGGKGSDSAEPLRYSDRRGAGLPGRRAD